MGTIKATNIEPIADNGTVTLGSSGDTFSLGSGVVQSNLLGPAFCVTKADHQTISLNTTTTVTLDTEILDSDNAFSSNSFTVPTGKGGKYLIGFQMAFRNSAAFFKIEFSVFKNSSEDQPTLKQNFASSIFESNFTNRIHTSVIRDLSAGDVLDLRALLNAGSGTAQIMSSSTLFYGYRIGT
jgi:hypothetical protein|tara:strand:- start:33 stop:578 length:546 start_codon:yes stop_codon:yes gene_type:complete